MIPVNEPLLNGNEKKYLAECIDTGWISSEGPFVRRLEEEFAARLGRKHGVAVCNGSAALDAAVIALGLGPGDEVIMPSFTIISCALAVIHAGATPVLVDAEPDTWNMDVRAIEDRITQRTRAIMVVHIYGLPVDMDPIFALAQKHNLRIIEDSAEAIGQTYSTHATGSAVVRACGGMGDISTLSFYPNKHVTTGEGGMVLTDDEELAERARDARNLFFGRKDRFCHEELGYNMRLSNLQAAVGVAQLERLDETLQKKRFIGRRYSELLAGVRGLRLPLAATNYADNVYWVFGVTVDDGSPVTAPEAMAALRDARIGTRPFFRGMHDQPVFRRMGLFKNVACPVSDRLTATGFYLPSGVAITDDQICEVAVAVKNLFG